ncbi:MAG TPA: hypothetical protein DEF78_10075 [Sphingobacterium sp.]|nr:hypothetical protein [Sphingobacterium sp.]
MSLTILCKDQQEIDYFWNTITKKGKESMCGWCKDEFGVSWQIVPEQIATLLKRPGANEALIRKKKIIIQELIG